MRRRDDPSEASIHLQNESETSDPQILCLKSGYQTVLALRTLGFGTHARRVPRIRTANLTGRPTRRSRSSARKTTMQSPDPSPPSFHTDDAKNNSLEAITTHATSQPIAIREPRPDIAKADSDPPRDSETTLHFSSSFNLPSSKPRRNSVRFGVDTVKTYHPKDPPTLFLEGTMKSEGELPQQNEGREKVDWLPGVGDLAGCEEWEWEF